MSKAAKPSNYYSDSDSTDSDDLSPDTRLLRKMNRRCQARDDDVRRRRRGSPDDVVFHNIDDLYAHGPTSSARAPRVPSYFVDAFRGRPRADDRNEPGFTLERLDLTPGKPRSSISPVDYESPGRPSRSPGRPSRSPGKPQPRLSPSPGKPYKSPGNEQKSSLPYPSSVEDREIVRRRRREFFESLIGGVLHKKPSLPVKDPEIVRRELFFDSLRNPVRNPVRNAPPPFDPYKNPHFTSLMTKSRLAREKREMLGVRSDKKPTVEIFFPMKTQTDRQKSEEKSSLPYTGNSDEARVEESRKFFEYLNKPSAFTPLKKSKSHKKLKKSKSLKLKSKSRKK